MPLIYCIWNPIEFKVICFYLPQLSSYIPIRILTPSFCLTIFISVPSHLSAQAIACFPSPQTIQTTQVAWRPGRCEIALRILYMHHSTGCPAGFSYMWVDSVVTCDNLTRTHAIIHFLQRAHSSKHLIPFIVFLNIDGVENILHVLTCNISFEKFLRNF